MSRNRRWCVTILLALVALALNGCSSLGSSASLFKQLGGMDTVKSLSSEFLKNVSGDSRVGGLLAGQDVSSLSSKLTSQICSMTGGDCKAPLSSQQIADAAKKIDPNTSSALSDNFTKALDTVTSSSTVRDSI